MKSLTLAWTVEADRRAGRPVAAAAAAAALIVGGEGNGDFPSRRTARSRARRSLVDGTLYVTTPDNAWALDARDGRELWHYFWKTRGGTHIANRGFGMWNDYLYMETPDNYLVSLEAKTGKERWHKEIADVQRAVLLDHGADRRRQPRDRRHRQRPGHAGVPAVVRSGDRRAAVEVLHRADEPGRPRAGDLAQPRRRPPWRRRSRGCPGVYDPETKLYIFGTGNPTPAFTQAGRGEGDNLFTSSLVAVNVDTGKMAWYFQTSPHDMHDWDSAQTPVLVDAVDQRQARASWSRPRRATATSSRSIGLPASTWSRPSTG